MGALFHLAVGVRARRCLCEQILRMCTLPSLSQDAIGYSMHENLRYAPFVWVEPFRSLQWLDVAVSRYGQRSAE
jgi:hypothetical protein